MLPGTPPKCVYIVHGRQPEGPAVDERINRMGCGHTVEYYAARERREALRVSIPGRDLEDTMQSKRRRTQKTPHRI